MKRYTLIYKAFDSGWLLEVSARLDVLRCRCMRLYSVSVNPEFEPSSRCIQGVASAHA
jgi:hypothetical protein